MEEILAHISASTTRISDDRYRAQAAAYFQFQASNRTDIFSRKSSKNLEHGSSGSLQSPVQAAPTNDTQLDLSKTNATHSRISPSVVHPETPSGKSPLEGHYFPTSYGGSQSSNLAAPTSSKSALEKLALIESRWKSSCTSNSTPGFKPRHDLEVFESVSASFVEDIQDAVNRIESQLLPGLEDSQSSLIGHEDRQSKRRRYSPTHEKEDHEEYPHSFDQTYADGVDSPEEPIASRTNCFSSASTEDMSSQLPLSYGLGPFDHDRLDYGKLVSSSQAMPEEATQPDPSEPSMQDEEHRSPSFIETRRLTHDTPDVNMKDPEPKRGGHISSSIVLTKVGPTRGNSDHSAIRSQNLPLVRSSARKPLIHTAWDHLDSSSRSEQQQRAEKSNLDAGTFNPVIENSNMHPRHSLQAKQKETVDFSEFPIRVQSPLPPTAHKKPSEWASQATRGLRDLMQRKDLANIYQPSSVNKKVNIGEPGLRGYWTLETSKWDLRIQHNFWKKMAEFIQKGYGSDVLMRRGRNEADDEVAPDHELGKVDVWCWAYLLEHTYRLIYVMSDSLVKRTGANWYTGPGNTLVIEIRPR